MIVRILGMAVLVCLAWPALLAAKSDSFSNPLYWPTYPQRTWFFTLCIVGAPISAWAAFVVGSRRGRSPRARRRRRS